MTQTDRQTPIAKGHLSVSGGLNKIWQQHIFSGSYLNFDLKTIMKSRHVPELLGIHAKLLIFKTIHSTKISKD